MLKNTSSLAAVASGNMTRRMYRWTLGLLLTGALAATAMPAMAQTPETTFVYGGASDFDFASCFGYKGHFRGRTYIAEVDWGDFSECFGIAPDRTIWRELAPSLLLESLLYPAFCLPCAPTAV